MEFKEDEYLDTREFLLKISSQNEESIFIEHKYSIPLGELLINMRKDHAPNFKDTSPKRTLCPHKTLIFKRIKRPNW